MDWFDFKYEFRYKVSGLCIWIIKFVNRGKDRCLSQSLFEVAEWYNTRPDTFNYWTPKGHHSDNYQKGER